MGIGIAFIVVLVIIIGIIGFIIGIFNALVRLRNQVDNAWSQIDVQLKRRHDLIPNLVEAVKGYAKHERETLESVIKARNMAMTAEGDCELPMTKRAEVFSVRSAVTSSTSFLSTF